MLKHERKARNLQTLKQGSENFVKVQIVNILGFVDHQQSVAYSSVGSLIFLNYPLKMLKTILSSRAIQKQDATQMQQASLSISVLEHSILCKREKNSILKIAFLLLELYLESKYKLLRNNKNPAYVLLCRVEC